VESVREGLREVGCFRGRHLGIWAVRNLRIGSGMEGIGGRVMRMVVGSGRSCGGWAVSWKAFRNRTGSEFPYIGRVARYRRDWGVFGGIGRRDWAAIHVPALF
jgi:hypothetical protein